MSRQRFLGGLLGASPVRQTEVLTGSATVTLHTFPGSVVDNGEMVDLTTTEDANGFAGWNGDGTAFWTVGNGTADILEWPCTTAYDPSTAGTPTQHYDGVASLGKSARNMMGGCWNHDGTRFTYLYDGSTPGEGWFEIIPAGDPYTMNSATDTITSDKNRTSVTSSSDPKSCCFNADGTRFYVSYDGNDTVYAYEPATAGVSTGTLTYRTNDATASALGYAIGAMAYSSEADGIYIACNTNPINIDLLPTDASGDFTGGTVSTFTTSLAANSRGLGLFQGGAKAHVMNGDYKIHEIELGTGGDLALSTVPFTDTSTLDTYDFSNTSVQLSATDSVGDYIGYDKVSISKDGNTAVASSKFDNGGAGHALVFEKSGGTWSQVAALTCPESASEVAFGHDNDISDDGTVIIVSDYQSKKNSSTTTGSNCGNVYVYEKGAGWADGTASHTKSFWVADNSHNGVNYLGDSITISGDGNTIAAGNRLGSSNRAYETSNKGSVYLWEKDGSWAATAVTPLMLISTSQATNGKFGVDEKYAVSLSEDGQTLAIRHRARTTEGRVEIHEAGGGGWTAPSLFSTTSAHHVSILDGTGSGNGHGNRVAISNDGLTIATEVDNTDTVIIHEKGAGWPSVGMTSQVATLSNSAGNAMSFTGMSKDGKYVTSYDSVSYEVLIWVKPATGWVDATETYRIAADATSTSTLAFGSYAAINDVGDLIISDARHASNSGRVEFHSTDTFGVISSNRTTPNVGIMSLNEAGPEDAESGSELTQLNWGSIRGRDSIVEVPGAVTASYSGTWGATDAEFTLVESPYHIQRINTGSWDWRNFSYALTGTNKYYCEIYIPSTGSNIMIGVANSSFSGNYAGQGTDGISLYAHDGQYYHNASASTGYGSSWNSGAWTVGMAVDLNAREIYWSLNGTWQGSSNPSTSSGGITMQNGIASGDVYINVADVTSATPHFHLNTGENGTFNGELTAGGNTDTNGEGDFKYSVPTGYQGVYTLSAGPAVTKLAPTGILSMNEILQSKYSV